MRANIFFSFHTVMQMSSYINFQLVEDVARLKQRLDNLNVHDHVRNDANDDVRVQVSTMQDNIAFLCTEVSSLANAITSIQEEIANITIRCKNLGTHAS